LEVYTILLLARQGSVSLHQISLNLLGYGTRQNPNPEPEPAMDNSCTAGEMKVVAEVSHEVFPIRLTLDTVSWKQNRLLQGDNFAC
jgi:hypothetical protein